MSKDLRKRAEEMAGTHNVIACPGCGAFHDPATFNSTKPVVCANCNTDLFATPEEVAKQRLSETELASRLTSLNQKANKEKVICITCFVIMVIAIMFESLLLGIPSVIATLVFGFKQASTSHEAKVLLANNITRDIMSEVFDESIYAAGYRLPDKTLREAKVIFNWDTATGSDLVQAKYKGHNISFSDVELSEKVESEDNNGNTTTSYITKFKGQWLVCDLDREVPARLRLCENAERSGKVGKKLLGERIEVKGDVRTENEEFNKRFRILTDDDHSAFYILTPHFMEFIINADNSANARTYLSFLENRVHILSDTGKDSFELQKNDGVNLEQIRRRMRSELKYITSILDELLRNEYLFGSTDEEGIS